MKLLDSRAFVPGPSLVEPHGITPSGFVYRNLDVASLYQAAVQREQATVIKNGALMQSTDPFFGRAAKSSFYVNDPDFRHDGKTLDQLIAWGDPDKGEFDNRQTTPEVFKRLRAEVVEYLSGAGDLYVNDGRSGRTEGTRLDVRVITSRAPSALFAHNIFLRLSDEELLDFKPGWTILHAPEVKAQPERDGTTGTCFIIVDLASRTTIIGGTKYHGQIKKSIFAVQNFELPLKGILTMHAGASEGETGLSAIHAGLSGTGKTTLSNTGHPVADDQICIELRGDGGDVLSNMEGGQYAKTEKLRREKEPETYDAIGYGTTAENLFVDGDGVPDYFNTSITANGRVGYPLDYVPTAKASGTAQAPANVTFLTADGFGVLPPVALLSVEGGKFHFAAGFTSKMPGTEKGVTEPKPTFSSFFGKPFMPLKPIYYMDLFGKMVAQFGTHVWLVNTGWLGPNRPGRERVDILASKAIINAVRDGQIDMSDDNFWYDPVFKLKVPKVVPGVDTELLDPRNAWSDADAYKSAANKLAGIFQEAIRKLPDIPDSVLQAGPTPAV